jgi:hypothetical protein
MLAEQLAHSGAAREIKRCVYAFEMTLSRQRVDGGCSFQQQLYDVNVSGF